MLLGFTFFMGLMLSRLLAFVLGFRTATAFLVMTGSAAPPPFGMAFLASVIKRDLTSMGKFLFVGARHLVAGIANLFIQSAR